MGWAQNIATVSKGSDALTPIGGVTSRPVSVNARHRLPPASARRRSAGFRTFFLSRPGLPVRRSGTRCPPGRLDFLSSFPGCTTLTGGRSAREQIPGLPTSRLRHFAVLVVFTDAGALVSACLVFIPVAMVTQGLGKHGVAPFLSCRASKVKVKKELCQNSRLTPRPNSCV